MADTVKKIGVQNSTSGYNYVNIGVDADKVDIDDTTLDMKIKTIETNISNKVNKISGKELSTNDYTTADKNKLSSIEKGANKTTIDSSMSSTSENPVQNKVINEALSGKAPTAHASTNTNYGVGSTSSYGHVKIANDLSQSSYADGLVLSAYQGKVLNDKCTPVDNLTSTATNKSLSANQGKVLNEKIENKIIFSTTEPDTVPAGSVIMVYK